MTQRRNFAAVGGFVLGCTGVVSYFVLVLRHDPRLHRLLDVPVLNLAVVVAGLVLTIVGVRQAVRRSHRGRVMAPVLAALTFALAGVFGWYLFVYSYQLPVAMRAPEVGSVAPDFTLPDERGMPVRLSGLRGRSVVLLFYRGFW